MFKITRTLLFNFKHSFGLVSVVRINNLSASPTLPELTKVQNNVETESVTKRVFNTRNSGIVAAAFASLKQDSSNGVSEIKTPYTDSRIEKAKTVDELLSISDGSGVSRRHALKVVSVLADWSTNGNVKLDDFEADPRFIKLCRVLTKGSNFTKPGRVYSKGDDLSTIMSVTADDEAAKLVATITLGQMVKVMQTLASKKRRSTQLLRSLAYNINRSTQKLDLKQSADLLYSMSLLNFPDENLLQRIGNDVVACLDSSLKKSAVVASIVTSLGLLRYKDTIGIIEALSNWIVQNHEICRAQDIFALFLTLATLNHEPPNADRLFEVLIPQVSSADAEKPTTWLDMVWSLVLLNRASAELISSVLSEEFLTKLENENNTSNAVKLKLLNINAAANHLVKSYSGNKLDDNSVIANTSLTRTKEKEALVASVLDTMKNLVHSDNYLRSNVNTGMGFFIDGECVMDKKFNPVTLDKYTNSSDHIKIAIIVQEYTDMCRGRIEPTGLSTLAARLLQAQNYRILLVPYNEYRIRDTLVHRVQYLESKLKALVHS